ncbi:uncharacterized protein BX664DRAFT_361234 [Halteromyces radiatus]|uniref:uncharacterized protein n=1 Tax=Halteromyces radiatus TaxID=101107 RepID=UPI00221E9358|nr:uncharacterized protein BX664DRAFT_361234 [Halteromyces radiatus]KAI8082954.1 hypothetical protein BX664DRAFT_361234 [Halteromyces radiatus]
MSTQPEEQEEENVLKQLLSQAAVLIGTSQQQQPLSKDIPLETQLTQRLQELKLVPDNNDESSETQTSVKKESSIQHTFVLECLHLLVSIQEALATEMTHNEKQTDRDYLGVRDLRLVHTLLQVVVSWGIYPCLLPGVGVPLSKRVKSGYTNHELLTSRKDTEATETERSQRTLLSITTQLVDIIARNEKTTIGKQGTTIASILLLRHLPDLYAALLQLAYQPVPSTTNINSPGNGSSISSSSSSSSFSPANMGFSDSVMTKENTNILTPDEKNKCARMFMWLFERSDLYRAMESLMLLLGTSPLHPVPAWLRSICGRFLSRILLKPTGVAVVLEFTVGNTEQIQLAEMEKISKLVLSTPRQMTSVESYYAVICPQLLEFLMGTNQQRSSTAKDQVVTFIVGRMIIKHTDLTKKYIVEPIIGPLERYWKQSQYDDNKGNDIISVSNNMDRVVIDDNKMANLLRTLHNIMVGGEPSPLVIQTFMVTIVPPLYHLYDFACRTKSGLRETVLDLLTTYFRIMMTKDVLDDLKKIILDPISIQGDRVAYFAPSSSGGIELRLKRERKSLGGNELPLDTTRLVEFLQTLDNPDLSGDFFVSLLNIYTTMQHASSATDPKSILMVLQLIMSMADTLGPNILGKPTQILSFANNIVMEHLDRIENVKNQQEQQQQQQGRFPIDLANIISEDQKEILEEHDDNFTVEDDLESLLLAIDLVRAVIQENDELNHPTIQLLTSILGPMKRLEKYVSDIMQEQVHEVILAITTLLSAHDMAKSKSSGNEQLEQSKIKYRDAMKALQDELLPIRAHGMGMLKEMILSKDPLVSSGTQLDSILDLFIQLVQDEDSFIYLNAIKGLSALTDIHGKKIIEKLGNIYSDVSEKLDNRLRVGEALLQTVQRCGDTLGTYINSLIKPLETVLASRQTPTHLRVSALSILSTACQTSPSALTGILWELTNWVLNILEIEKAPEIRRAGTVLILSLFRGMAQQTLYDFPADNLRRAYRTLRYIEHSDPDELTRHQARVALSDLDMIMRGELFKSNR